MRKEEKYRAENQDRLCYCCDTFQSSTKHINKYTISYRGYGSIFDSCHFTVQLCDKCKDKIKEEWFNEQPSFIDGYCEDYKYEEVLDKFLHSLPIQNQEYIFNHMDGYTMDREDWLAMQNETLPDFKYTEYGMYSPSEVKSYEERFPTCEYPVIRKYKDGSQGCWCPFGAYGDFQNDKVTTGLNVCNECHYCKYYKPRESKIRTVLNTDFDDYDLYVKSKLEMNNLKEKFE